MGNRDVHEYQFQRGLFASQLLHINSGLLWVLYIGMKSDVYIWKETYMLKRPIFPSSLAHQLGFVVGTVPMGLSRVLCHCTGFARLVWGTEWRRPIGCLALQVIFRERTTNYRALWRKMTDKDKASYGSSPPCESNVLAKLLQIENRQYTNHPIWLENRQKHTSPYLIRK